ncbi:MAG TPA: hypothetical protein VFG34_03680 [Sphingopyxis sp.]|nr:hypothetical protein [Sphingopyxis sp.]
MLMAARKLQNIGLVLLVLIFAMILYPVSLKVAAERSELARIENQINRARENIRYLEAELAVRASLAQLEKWNADSFGYAAPTADQYLTNERQLASLDRLPHAIGANDVEPVLMAMVSPVDLTDHKKLPQLEGPGRANPIGMTLASFDVQSDASPQMVQTRRREQLRMIEDQLLAKSTLAELKAAAVREAEEGASAQ